MAENVLQLGVNVDNRTMVDSNNGYYHYKTVDVLRLIASEKPVIGATFYDNTNTAVAFGASDTFELSVDANFTQDNFTGVTNNAYTGAVTSIVGTFIGDLSNIYDTGHITLKKDNGSRETVAYTAMVVVDQVVTFAVDKTLTNSYDSGDYIGIQDELMIRVDEDNINQGEWTEEDKTAGKLSFIIDCTNDVFTRKLIAAGVGTGSIFELRAYIEIKRYPLGGVIPIVLLQDRIFTKLTINDLES